MTSFSRGMILITSPVLIVITILLPTASIVSILSTLLHGQTNNTFNHYWCTQELPGHSVKKGKHNNLDIMAYI